MYCTCTCSHCATCNTSNTRTTVYVCVVCMCNVWSKSTVKVIIDYDYCTAVSFVLIWSSMASAYPGLHAHSLP